jgi:hypothetical protein
MIKYTTKEKERVMFSVGLNFSPANKSIQGILKLNIKI